MEYTQIDLEKATVEEIRAEIERMKQLSNEWKNEEQAIKLTINSIYGALGNKWLVCFNPEVAETITLQGQDLIKHAEKALNMYFNVYWHKDTELHEKLGLANPPREVKRPVNIYSDTDSCYVSFEEVLESCSWQGDPKEFILKINEHRLAGFLNGAFEKYAKERNTKNHMDFELENISEAGIWLAKKKYLINEVWESGIDIDSLSHIIYKGVELAQSSTPIFAREKLKELVKYVFTQKKNLDKSKFIDLLKQIKNEFKLANPESISMGRSINDYNKFVMNDTTAFEVAKSTPIHVRAAGYYNYILNKDPKAKGKYQLIRSGDKVKFYYTKVKNKNLEENVFAFLPGNFPYEFAPPVDYDEQFSKTILDPMNRIMVAMGLGEILPGLQKITSATEVTKEYKDEDLKGFDPFAI